MTLQQLKYIIGIVNSGSINEAAKRLFISQPSLSKAVRELENELNFEIFRRSSKGISLSLEGTEFPFLRAPSCGTGGTSGTALPEYKTSQTPIFHLDSALRFRRQCFRQSHQKTEHPGVRMDTERNENLRDH